MPAIEALYAFGDDPRIYYVEAAAAYRELGQPLDECRPMAFGTGWFVREGGQVKSLLTVVDLLNCDRAGASYMLPARRRPDRQPGCSGSRSSRAGITSVSRSSRLKPKPSKRR